MASLPLPKLPPLPKALVPATRESKPPLVTRLRQPRQRTAVGTTPPVLRGPDVSDGVPASANDDYAWLDLMDI